MKLFLIKILNVRKIVLTIRLYRLLLDQNLMIDIHFKPNILKMHVKSDIEKDLISNSIFIRKCKKKCATNDCKDLKF